MSSLKKKIDGLSTVDFSVPSEVEVEMDELASALISAYELDEDEEMTWGRTPSLSDVIEELAKREMVSDDATGLCWEIVELLKEAYDGELDEDDAQAVEESIEKLQGFLRVGLKIE
jgi:hypothetical protein